MNYTVSVDERKKVITVVLDGYKGVAKCCDTDHFNLATGIELALERAKVAKRTAETKAETTLDTASTTELAKALESRLPKNGIVVIGEGKALSDVQKKRLLSLVGCPACGTSMKGVTEVYVVHDYGENEVIGVSTTEDGAEEIAIKYLVDGGAVDEGDEVDLDWFDIEITKCDLVND